MIHLNQVTYQYPKTDHPALHGISLDIPAGQFCGIVGASEAGKSTLCYLLAGFIPHFYRGQLTGEIQVAGYDLHTNTSAQLGGEIGLVFQNPFNQISGARFTVREEVAFGLENLGVSREEMRERIPQILEATGLNELAERSPYTLSGGQQQRLALASIMVMHPRVLILDEPTSQLDPAGTQEVFESMRQLSAQEDLTVVLASHKLEWLATFSDRVIALQDGAILADGKPQEVLTDPEVIRLVGSTRYTSAARLARERGLVGAQHGLPVTLSEAKEFFTQ